MLSLHTFILIGMVVKLIIVWFLAVVAFFALWAILATVIKRVSEKKRRTENGERKTEETILKS